MFFNECIEFIDINIAFEKVFAFNFQRFIDKNFLYSSAAKGNMCLSCSEMVVHWDN